LVELALAVAEEELFMSSVLTVHVAEELAAK
jgi:hypothetical protein